LNQALRWERRRTCNRAVTTAALLPLNQILIQ
jgi:hypothetical protein